MLFRAECCWCGDRVSAFAPARRREFRADHEVSCGASGNLSWLADVRETLAGADHGSDLVLGQRVVDLRDAMPVARSA